MKPADIKKKARDKAAAMPPKQKLLEFADKEGKPGSCQVTIPAQRFSYSISRIVAENLLVKHGDNLPFDVMRPIGVNEDDDWKEVTLQDLPDGEHLPKYWNVFEIWLPAPTDDLPSGLFQKPGK